MSVTMMVTMMEALLAEGVLGRERHHVLVSLVSKSSFVPVRPPQSDHCP